MKKNLASNGSEKLEARIGWDHAFKAMRTREKEILIIPDAIDPCSKRWERYAQTR